MTTPTYAASRIAECLAEAENAKNNALVSIERAYLPPSAGAPAAFILLTCLIDFLGTLYAGKKSSGETFQKFVTDFMKQTRDGVSYDGKRLYTSLRNGLVHNYSILQGKYILTHHHSEKHLRLQQDSNSTILNLEDFFGDVKQAADDYFMRVSRETTLQHRLLTRISKVGTIVDVDI